MVVPSLLRECDSSRRRHAFDPIRVVPAAALVSQTTMKSFVPVLGIILIIFGVPALLTRGPVARWLNDRVDRREPRRLQDPIYALLRREVQHMGETLEALPYERLLEPDESVAYQATVLDGIEIAFSTEVVSVEKNGDIHVCIDAYANAPGWEWHDVLPSYSFKKRKDGSVYY